MNALLKSLTSLLTIRFMALHLTDDIVRGMELGGVSIRCWIRV